jgi:hypothetical protein
VFEDEGHPRGMLLIGYEGRHMYNINTHKE